MAEKLISGYCRVLNAARTVLADSDDKAVKSARNIEGVKVAGTNTISTYDIVNADSVVIVKDAVKMLEEVYA